MVKNGFALLTLTFYLPSDLKLGIASGIFKVNDNRINFFCEFHESANKYQVFLVSSWLDNVSIVSSVCVRAH